MEKKTSLVPGSGDSLWKTATWYHATTLTERATSQHAGMHTCFTGASGDKEKALKRLHRWKEQAPFDQETFFADRLAQDGLTEQGLLDLLSEPIEAVQARLPGLPRWLEQLQETFADMELSGHAPLPKLPPEAATGTGEFLTPMKPLLQYGLKQLDAGIRDLVTQYANLPFDQQTIGAILLMNLIKQVLPKVSRTLVLELNVARLQGHLSGETPEERFQSYIDWLSQPEHLLSLLQEYNVLARQLMTTIEHWVDFSLEFLQHLCADWQKIREVFSPESDPGMLTSATGGAGDTHRGGRSVMLLRFNSGLQLVYKPKSLAIDVHFQELLTWLNDHNQQPTFRTLKLIDGGSYGWTEFIIASSCESEEEVIRFYERQGAYLALLYALNAADFHHENIIAMGEYPMLIDLEALFHAHTDHDLPLPPAQQALNHSVLTVGLLPSRVWGNKDIEEGVDISGLGGQEGQLIPHPMPRWTELGTDQMRLVRERVEMESQQNRPKLNGQDIQTTDYCEHLIRGFARMYRLLITYRDELRTELLLRFAHDEVRFIARATRMYALLLHDSFHPNMLRDGLQRERSFDRLWRAAQFQSAVSRLIPAERADLLQGDIPMFTAHPDSRAIYTSQGEAIPDFLTAPGLLEVKKRISHLDEEDLSWQIWIIRASFTSMATGANPEAQKLLQLQPSHTFVTRQRLIEGAQAVGERLSCLTIHNEGAAGWLSIVQTKDSRDKWNLRPADIGLYGGNSGIALFLGYLGQITGEVHFTELARRALKTIRQELTQLKKRPEIAEIGAFIGLGGPIYLFSHLGILWNEPALFQEAQELIDLLPELIEKDDRLDIISGSAGCIASLLSLYAVAPSASTLVAAVQCGDHLLAHAQTMEVGLGWRTRAYSYYPPTPGFAHGTAGIAWSLLNLAELSGQERFRKAALAGLDYERSLYSPEMQDWFMPPADSPTPPTPVQQERQRVAMSWNQGAPGIGLSRLASLKYINETLIRDELDIALEQTFTEGFGRLNGFRPNHSLSHGYFGNLETVLAAAQTLDEPQYHDHLNRFTAMLLDSIERHGWVAATPFNVETPGLMVGLAGIGYELLRLAEPEKVSSVLLLAPPSRDVINHVPTQSLQKSAIVFETAIV